MEASNANFKVSFYLKKKNSRKGLCPVMGRITIEKEMVQFSCKLEANPKLWNTRAGRMNGKSDHARAVNREIDKINVAINAGYREIVSIRGKATSAGSTPIPPVGERYSPKPQAFSRKHS